VRVDLGIVGDVGGVIEDMIKVWRARGKKPVDLQHWWADIAGWRAWTARTPTETLASPAPTGA
jgi:acetolactate synthase-1/2/3 large subunit